MNGNEPLLIRTVETAFSTGVGLTLYLDLPVNELPFEGETVSFSGLATATPRGVYVVTSVSRTYDVEDRHLAHVYVLLTQREKR